MASIILTTPPPQQHQPAFSLPHHHPHVNATIFSSPLQHSSTLQYPSNLSLAAEKSSMRSLSVENTVLNNKPKITLRFRAVSTTANPPTDNDSKSSDGDIKVVGANHASSIIINDNNTKQVVHDPSPIVCKKQKEVEAKGLSLLADTWEACNESAETKKRMMMKKRAIPSFSISLTKEEIEADFLAITGGKRHKRVKKRPRIVQKQMDSVFPGLGLSSVTPHSYKLD